MGGGWAKKKWGSMWVESVSFNELQEGGGVAAGNLDCLEVWVVGWGRLSEGRG